ncbi:MAG: hypothetical protein B7733_00235 [Myxococcales bacterium FL481]|nr:MAG: hypothetical protein B7733_00235 [Myxococcales bacterium FL481]
MSPLAASFDPHAKARTTVAATASVAVHVASVLFVLSRFQLAAHIPPPPPPVVRAVAAAPDELDTVPATPEANSPPPAPEVLKPAEPEPKPVERTRRKLDKPEPPPEPPPGPPPPPALCEGCALTSDLTAADVEPAPPGSEPGRATVPLGVPGGKRGGVLGGVSGGVVGGTIGGELGAPRPPASPAKRQVRRARSRLIRPLKEVMAQARWAPNPPEEELKWTRTGLGSQRPGVSRTAFCINKRGRTEAVRTVTAFPGDPGVDAICRQTVQRWRFKPFRVGGRRMRVCTTVSFRIRFVD